MLFILYLDIFKIIIFIILNKIFNEKYKKLIRGENDETTL